MSQWAQAFGHVQICPVGFGRILDSQNDGHGVETTIRRLNMTLENILGRNVIVCEKAIGGFQHGRILGRIRQRCGRALAKGVRQFDQALRAPHIAQVGRAEFLLSPRIHQGNIGNIQSHPPSMAHTLVDHRGIVPQQWNDSKMWVMISRC